jgi:hypothetical protein
MQTLQRLTLTVLVGLAMLVGLALAACTRVPAPYPGQPWVGPNGRVVQPPPEGWPDYTHGGADVGGSRN